MEYQGINNTHIDPNKNTDYIKKYMKLYFKIYSIIVSFSDVSLVIFEWLTVK